MGILETSATNFYAHDMQNNYGYALVDETTLADWATVRPPSHRSTQVSGGV